jgi:uncharacterized protein YqgC (DUF456 family)
MPPITEILRVSYTVAGYAGIVLLCLGGIVLSACSLSGTWLVLVAAALAAWLREAPFPGLWTLVAFTLTCLAVEGAEALAGLWGIRARGGSWKAGVAATAGGLLGLVVGGILPVPFVGNVVGMLLGSFLLAFAVEHRRLGDAGPASHIATGAVVARVAVILLKTAATLAMAAFLLGGLLLSGRGEAERAQKAPHRSAGQRI